MAVLPWKGSSEGGRGYQVGPSAATIIFLLAELPAGSVLPEGPGLTVTKIILEQPFPHC